MSKIKIAIAGIGNCASSLIQGIHYYSDKSAEQTIGLMHYNLGGYMPRDIEVVAAIDIDKRKVGRDLSQAIYAKPNCTPFFCTIPYKNVKVRMGRILDGYSKHMSNRELYSEDEVFVPSSEKEIIKGELVELLRDSGAELFVNYLPVGSQKAVEFYADCCLEARIGFINCMPVFIATNNDWSNKFEEKNLPIIGDDVKSQVGATIINRVLAELFESRGARIEEITQLNYGGNTDFLNMKNTDRLRDKKISKTQSVQSVLNNPLPKEWIHIGPSDYVPKRKDEKIADITINARGFGDQPIRMDLKLKVIDSPNSGGVVIDAIRCMKLALDRGVGGILYSPSAYFMKSPPKQTLDSEARRNVEKYIRGELKK